VFGARFRAAARRGAQQSNAYIANEVVSRRITIANGKQEARAALVRLREKQLVQAKKELKAESKSTQRTVRTKQIAASSPTDPVYLLQKLKEAHDLGFLNDAEYEAKKRELLTRI